MVRFTRAVLKKNVKNNYKHKLKKKNERCKESWFNLENFTSREFHRRYILSYLIYPFSFWIGYRQKKIWYIGARQIHTTHI